MHVSAVDGSAAARAASTRPTGPGSSAGAGRRPTPRRSTRARRSRGRRRRCSTRSSASAAGSGSSRAARRSSPSPPAWPTTRDEALALADQYREPSAVARAFELAWAHSQVEHRHRRWSPRGRRTCSSGWRRTSSSPAPALRADAGRPRREPPGPARPLAVRHLGRPADRAGPRRRARASCRWPASSLAAHAYLRPQGAASSTWSCSTSSRRSYLDELHQAAAWSWSGRATRRDLIDQPGGVFVREGVADAGEDDGCCSRRRPGSSSSATAARWPASSTGSSGQSPPAAARPAATREPGGWRDEPVALPDDLLFANGLGGFTPDGREYVRARPALAEAGRPAATASPTAEPSPRPVLPPAPWVNVVANPAFGFLVSEAGSGFTWAGNSQTNRLTPWSNDPVSDPPGEVVYLRDEETGEVWSPTPLPVPSGEPTLVRHGQGYTVFERRDARPRPRADPVRPARGPGQDRSA